MATRIDHGTLRAPKRRADGSIRVDAAIARTGVQEYRADDGSIRREYRPDAEVGDRESLESFAGVPVTNDHPKALLTAKTARTHARGASGDLVRLDGKQVIATLYVFDADTVRDMERGKAEVSCGYECDLDETPGVTPEGERYDAIQRRIRGNHIALVWRGRAGRDVRARLDGALEQNQETSEMTEQEMQERVDTAEAKVAEAEKARKDAEDARAAAERELAKAESDLVTERARADAAEKARTDAAESGKERVKLEVKARAVLGDEARLDGMSDRAVMVAVVKAVEKVDVAASRSDDYVLARFDAAIERKAKAVGSLGDARKVKVDSDRTPLADADLDEAAKKKKMEEDSANAWRSPKA